MSQVEAQIGTSDWNLTGIAHQGGICGHCDRDLKHTYAVRNRVTGETMTVGRACCKKVTGWTLAAAEAARILRHAARQVVRDANWAAFVAAQPEIAARLKAAYAIDVERSNAGYEVYSAAYYVIASISDGNEIGGVKYATEILALPRYAGV